MGSLVSTQKGSMAVSLKSIELAFRELVGPEFAKAVTTCVASMDWADDEIAQAQRRHPDITDVLYHSFSLLTATHDRMSTEFIYRPHARELTERVAAGTSTKPGTSVEVALSLMQASLVTPLNTTAFGLYLRMWRCADLPSLGGPIQDLDDHYEAIAASSIDDLESVARHKLSVPDRVLTLVTCEGRHHGEPVDCRLATARAA
ncbi:hypothetical protein ACGFIX_34860 [Nocardia salmonicida]|uniref:hypothetical protein n=1 Tax=Nocardia salmonicida TaxID=53431 RepID=UPI0037117A58